MVMTTGEFEFDTIFYSDTLDFAVISYILWIIFIIFMPVLLTNLLVCSLFIVYVCLHTPVLFSICVHLPMAGCGQLWWFICPSVSMCSVFK